MLGKFRNLLIACGITVLAVLSLIGCITSTLSWFTYMNRSGFVYTGTTILSNKQLQVGILIEDENEDIVKETEEILLTNGLYIEIIDKSNGDVLGTATLSTPNRSEEVEVIKNYVSGEEPTVSVEEIAWSNPGEGLSNEQITSYLIANGYASQFLRPVTSRRFATDQEEELKIYGSPYEYRPDNITEANRSEYCKIPLCFRVISSMDRTYRKGCDIWISDAHAIGGTSSEGFNVADGARVHFASENTQFIFKPAASDAGSTAVCGLLDINGDGYYDYTTNNETGEKKEIMYGDCSDTPEYTYFESDSELSDLNNTGKNFEYIFNSKHGGGVNCIESYDSITVQQAQYESLSSVRPETSESLGALVGGRPVAITGDDYVGHAEMTFWIEGWDQAVVNQIWSMQFNMSILFEINKI